MPGCDSAGARWLRCDLHVHTPFDGEKKFGEDIRGAIDAFKKMNTQRFAEIAERFVGACRSAANGEGLDLVALTDHNSIDGYRYLKPQFESLAQQAKDQGLQMPSILPGVEFSIGGERPIHFLVIFSSNTDAGAIDGAITHVFGPSDRFDPGNGNPRTTGQSVDDFLKRLFEYCRPPSGDRHMEFVVLPAHADDRKGALRETTGELTSRDGKITVATTLWDEMKGHLRQRVITRRDWNGFQTASSFDRLPQPYKDLLFQWSAARRGDKWETLTEGQKERFRELRHWPLIECSDPHKYEAIGARYTWLKMEIPDVEGIRLSLLDPESRLRRMADGPPTHRYTHLESLRIRNTDFFDDIQIPFSPCLTTLIGGRGSGKSTVIEYLRHALDRARQEDFTGEGMKEIRGVVQQILGQKDERDFGESEGTLLPSFTIDLDAVVAGRHYRLKRDSGGLSILKDPDTPDEEPVPLDARSLVTPRILSQRQIARIAKDSSSQRHEIDALIDQDEMAEISKSCHDLQNSMAQLQIRRSQLSDQMKTLPGRETELQKVKDQIIFLEQGSRREVLSQFEKYELEREWLENTIKELQVRSKNLREQHEAIKAATDGLPAIPDGSPSTTWLTQIAKLVADRFVQTSASIEAESTSIQDLIRLISEQRSKQWQPAYDQARTAYETLRAEMEERGVDFGQHEKLLQQRTRLEREVTGLRSLSNQLENLETTIQKTRSELVQIHEKRLALRRGQASTLEEVDADVRIEVIPFGDRNDFESRREEWFAGTGLQERDWSTLVENVFKTNGSVSDRIAALVKAFRNDLQVSSLQGRPIDHDTSAVAELLTSEGENRLTGHFFRVFERSDRLRLDEMERFLPEDAVEARVRTPEGDFKPITTGSVGQRSTAILSLLLSAGDQPLVIDQPEDDLDNRYVYDVVVNLLRQKKFSRQIIIATHNANIPVNGDAELIVALGVEDRMGSILCAGSIDHPEIKDHVSVIMEGSAEAFRLRRDRYGY